MHVAWQLYDLMDATVDSMQVMLGWVQSQGLIPKGSAIVLSLRWFIVQGVIDVWTRQHLVELNSCICKDKGGHN